MDCPSGRSACRAHNVGTIGQVASCSNYPSRNRHAAGFLGSSTTWTVFMPLRKTIISRSLTMSDLSELKSDLDDLIERYFAMWNETNAERRRDLIARTWTEKASYLDPLMQGDGRDGIDAMVQAVQDRFPGHKFHLTSPVDSHHDNARFSWELASEAGAPVVRGIDFAVIAGG